MNPYCNPLILDIPPLREGYDITKNKKKHISISLDEINPEIKKFLFNLGIIVSWIELFYRISGHKGAIHADNLSGDFTKINWVYKGKNSHMLWFTIKDHIKKKKVNSTIADTTYLSYSIDEVKCVHSAKMTGAFLVQVGVPHLVVNPTEDRYCLCFVLTDLEGKRLNMSEAQNLLGAYILKHT